MLWESYVKTVMLIGCGLMPSRRVDQDNITVAMWVVLAVGDIWKEQAASCIKIQIMKTMA
jgi:hypothetical protein